MRPYLHEMLTICGCPVNIDSLPILRDNELYASWLPKKNKKKKKGAWVFKTPKNEKANFCHSEKKKKK